MSCDQQVRARGVCARHYARWRYLVGDDPDPPAPADVLDQLDGGASGAHPMGARTTTANGYVLVKVGRTHPMANPRGWCYEHRLEAADKLGRPLEPGERVTHVNGIRDDNRPSNLAVT